MVRGPIGAPVLDAETKAFVAQAVAACAVLDWNVPGEVWSALTASLKAQTGRKGKELFLPLRQALTAMDHGPDMKALLPLIGRDEALARLNAAAG